MRVGIAGIGGRMGVALVGSVARANLTLAGGISRDGAGDHGDIGALARCCDVVIDFTHPGAVLHHAAALGRAGIGWVLGTTGLDDAQQQAVVAAARHIAVVQSANFSPGVTLLIDLAHRLGRALPGADYDAEILEMHHRAKLDAPSGTALALGQSVAAGRDVDLAQVGRRSRDGQAGPRPTGEIGFATLRGGAIVGEHTLSLTSDGEQISISHRAFDRRCFADGAVRAAVWTASQPPGLYSMRDVLNLPA